MRKFRVAFARPYESGETLHVRDGGSTLKIIIVDQLGRTLLGMRAKFCFLELQDHKLMVQSMYLIIMINRVWRGIYHTVTQIIDVKKASKRAHVRSATERF